ncbi:MAG TPA: ribosome biogenesis factor YjgA [Steroidobacteraceae bacterium]|nr:ribosome biogenesis factor YjgA [Steroidobacteraceae bacterium]
MTIPQQDGFGDDGGAPERPPSKSARKRTALAAQQLGEALIELSDAQLDALDLPERLAEALRAARGIRSRAAGVRQRQYIGRLMRDVDLAAIRRALDARRASAALEAQRFRILESWRERLIEAGPGALEELARLHPQIDRGEWQRALEAARAERAQPATVAAGAGRRLFRMLRALLQPSAGALPASDEVPPGPSASGGER